MEERSFMNSGDTEGKITISIDGFSVEFFLAKGEKFTVKKRDGISVDFSSSEREEIEIRPFEK